MAGVLGAPALALAAYRRRAIERFAIALQTGDHEEAVTRIYKATIYLAAVFPQSAQQPAPKLSGIPGRVASFRLYTLL